MQQSASSTWLKRPMRADTKPGNRPEEARIFDRLATDLKKMVADIDAVIAAKALPVALP